ncbi:alpha/beta fold hydrolase [Pengzhenrongella phosphoraccumulans]|uniref:alpha/beta fold hydrolase n=1 Tax=Pengzhenrongella phosphoraccumulans TaxID=3114394 RepID=UPI00388F5502
MTRRRRTRWVVVAVVAVLTAGGALVAADLRSGPAIATRSQLVAGVPEAGAAVELDTTVYLPATTPAPAVLLAHGFGGSKADLDAQARSLAEHGYVVLAYTARGFGRSGGLIHLDAPTYEVADASALVSYLATLPQVRTDSPGDPRVGVAGSSYGGGLALLLGGLDPRVDAIGADITWNDLSQALFPNGTGTEPGVFKKLWAGQLFASAAGQVGGACGRFDPDLCAAYQRSATSGVPDAAILSLLAASSPAGVLDRITAPTLLSQGEDDSLFPLGQADANARAIAATGTPVKVVWRAGGHDGGTSRTELVQNLENWFDPVLRGTGRPDTTFEVTVPGSGISATTGRTVSQSLQLDGGYVSDQTVAAPLSGEPQTIYAPAGGSPAAVTSVPGLGGLLGTAAGLSGTPSLSAIPGQVATFDTPPLETSRLVAGSSTVSLQISSPDAADATLFVSLHHLGADGSDTLPSGLVAPVRLTGLTPDVPQTVTVALPWVVENVPAGDHLAVQVATTDLAYALPLSPRSYTIALADPTVTVATLDGRFVRTGQPWLWLAAGLAAMTTMILGTWLASVRRRRRRSVVAELAGVPVAIDDLVKEYGDGYRAVDGVSFRVEAGQVVGLLGPNGAGKTTTLRVLMGLIRPTSGTVRVFGELVEAGAPVLSRIGSFIEGPGLLPHLSGRENLRLFWAATGRPEQDAELETALEIAGLGASVDRRVRTFSQGMKQRLAIAQAMLGLPELLVLDEPTNGLDPLQIAEMREVLRRYAATGRTVVISSHLLAEVEQTCSHVVVMHKGALVAVGSVAEIAGAGAMQLAVTDPERAQKILSAAGVDSQAVPARRALEDIFIEMVGSDQ